MLGRGGIESPVLSLRFGNAPSVSFCVLGSRVMSRGLERNAVVYQTQPHIPGLESALGSVSLLVRRRRRGLGLGEFLSPRPYVAHGNASRRDELTASPDASSVLVEMSSMLCIFSRDLCHVRPLVEALDILLLFSRSR